MKKARFIFPLNLTDFFIISFLFISNLYVQFHNFGKAVLMFSDEGVYLYTAKLLNQGFIPYKDIFLAHPPFLIYLLSALLKICQNNLYFVHYIYVIWVFSSIIPIYWIVITLTKNRLAAILSVILFSTFPELAGWNAHYLALRPASLPFLSYALFFIFIKPKLKLAGFLLSLFSLSVFSNLLITLAFISSLILGEMPHYKNEPSLHLKKRGFGFFSIENRIFEIFKEYFPLLVTFLSITIISYLLIFLIPNSLSNIIDFQKNRPWMSFDTRTQILMMNIITNLPIILMGTLGSLIIHPKLKLFGIFNIASLGLAAFWGPFYYSHYLSILSVGFSISAGVFISYFGHTKVKMLLWTLLVLALIYFFSYPKLKTALFDMKTPDFFLVVEQLKNTPEPLFTFEPIYGLYANRNLTFHYNAADMRYFRVLQKNLSDEQYLNILKRSNTVFIEPFANLYLTPASWEYIKKNFKLKYSGGENKIYTRKN